MPHQNDQDGASNPKDTAEQEQCKQKSQGTENELARGKSLRTDKLQLAEAFWLCFFVVVFVFCPPTQI